jgi:hypothetical protein
MSVWALRYRHGAETVEAFRWTGDDTRREGPQWAADALERGMMQIVSGGQPVRLLVWTRSGWSTAKPGDWIVRWPSQRMEVCSEAVFSKRCATIPPLLKKTDNAHARPDLSCGSHRRKRKLPLY